MEIDFKTVIGLEIHVQLATKSKMFCRCDNESNEVAPNTNVCPRCLGMPGTLPVANRQAIEWTIKTGLALNCDIPEMSKFDRKHYFYPDLPKGYQISQYDMPLCKGGWLEINIQDIRNNDQTNSKLQIPNTKKIVLNRIHLEEDAGKLVHKGKDSLVDLNRAGTPLMEIVTEPCIDTPAEARTFLQDLQLLIRYLKVSEASMEKGHLRCDANISVQVESGEHKGKCSEIVEIKNLNSFKFVEKALMYEEVRIRENFANWPAKRRKVTRGYDSDKDITFEQRQKEEASDYRYFPEPDVPPIQVKTENSKHKTEEVEFDVEEIRNSIGTLPEDLKRKLADNNIPERVAQKIVSNPHHAWYVMEAENLGKEIALWVTEEVNAAIAHHQIDYKQYQKNVPITHLADLLGLVSAGKISSSTAKEVFLEMVKDGRRALEIVAEKGLEQVSDSGEIEAIVSQIIKNNPAETARLKSGENKLVGFFVGQIMKESKGKANPQVASKVLMELIKK